MKERKLEEHEIKLVLKNIYIYADKVFQHIVSSV